MSLKQAREARDAARRLVAQGVDPSVQRQATKAAGVAVAENTFEALAREWLVKQRAAMADATYSKATWMFEDLAFPWIGARPVSEIDAPEMLSVLRRIEARGKLETAHRLKQQCSRVFRYAIATGRASRDPCPDLRGALAAPVVTHRASITDPQGVGELLRTIYGYRGSFITACALRLAPLTFVRPGELRHAEWSEIDLNAAEWRLPAGKMKSRAAHVRAMARTLLAELGWKPDAIERQLAHKASGPLGAAYDRAQYSKNAAA